MDRCGAGTKSTSLVSSKADVLLAWLGVMVGPSTERGVIASYLGGLEG